MGDSWGDSPLRPSSYKSGSLKSFPFSLTQDTSLELNVSYSKKCTLQQHYDYDRDW